jgi:hypothetical protein
MYLRATKQFFNLKDFVFPATKITFSSAAARLFPGAQRDESIQH